MSALTDYAERLVLNAIFQDDALALNDGGSPKKIWFALFTAAPGEAGGGTEVSGGSYARVGVEVNATNFPDAATVTNTTTIKNGTTIQFPTATANWGTVTHFAIFDASAAGNMIFHGALSSARAVVTGDAPRFAADAFVLTCD